MKNNIRYPRPSFKKHYDPNDNHYDPFHPPDDTPEEVKWRFWYGDDWEKEKEDWEKNGQPEWDRKLKLMLELQK
jgi:hypothetical protein